MQLMGIALGAGELPNDHCIVPAEGIAFMPPSLELLTLALALAPALADPRRVHCLRASKPNSCQRFFTRFTNVCTVGLMS